MQSDLIGAEAESDDETWDAGGEVVAGVKRGGQGRRRGVHSEISIDIGNGVTKEKDLANAARAVDADGRNSLRLELFA